MLKLKNSQVLIYNQSIGQIYHFFIFFNLNREEIIGLFTNTSAPLNIIDVLLNNLFIVSKSELRNCFLGSALAL